MCIRDRGCPAPVRTDRNLERTARSAWKNTGEKAGDPSRSRNEGDVYKRQPIATAANIAQGAAALALALKTKNQKLKALALPSSLSAFLGITEPAIFGVNLRFFKCFIAGCIGGACGALVAGVTGIGASAYGITGLFGYLITTDYTIQYTLVILVAAAVAFLLSWILFKEENVQAADISVPAADASVQTAASSVKTEEGHTVYCPIKGEVIELKDVKDETFAGEVLGKGAAILPSEGKVYAPFAGKIETLFDTKHAIGIAGGDGMEVLIHIGINTVELGGKFYEAHVKEGEEVRAGQLLITFDKEQIQDAGYDITTPVIVTNTFDYEEVSMLKTGTADVLDKIIAVR